MKERRLCAYLLSAMILVSLFAVPSLTQAGAYGFDNSQSRYDRDLLVQQQRANLLDPAGPDASAPTNRERAASLAGDDTPAGLEAAGIDELHEQGITGDGVKVGVIGSAFDANHDSIESRVVAQRRYRQRSLLDRPRTRHDTAVAEVVARTAPDADLYLVGLGTSPTGEEYAEGVEWLLERDVDVIVDSGSYFSVTSNGMREISDVADRAADDDVVFVTSAGNYANRHWSGVADGDGFVSFAPETERNYLDGGKRTRGPVSIHLYWNTTADYDVYLYRDVRGKDPVVAKSERRQRGNLTAQRTESIDANLPTGRYYVAVYARNDTTNGTQLQLFTAQKTLSRTTANGSLVAPATNERVITVGAVDGETGRLRPYSSRGESLDIGAPDGVDTTVAGRFYGTSAAAPYVAGTAALMESRGGDLSSSEVEQILEGTAHNNSGRQIDVLAAVKAATYDRAGVGSVTPNETTSNGSLSNATAANGTNASASVGVATVTAGNSSATETGATNATAANATATDATATNVDEADASEVANSASSVSTGLSEATTEQAAESR